MRRSQLGLLLLGLSFASALRPMRPLRARVERVAWTCNSAGNVKAWEVSVQVSRLRFSDQAHGRRWPVVIYPQDLAGIGITVKSADLKLRVTKSAQAAS